MKSINNITLVGKIESDFQIIQRPNEEKFITFVLSTTERLRFKGGDHDNINTHRIFIPEDILKYDLKDRIFTLPLGWTLLVKGSLECITPKEEEQRWVGVFILATEVEVLEMESYEISFNGIKIC